MGSVSTLLPPEFRTQLTGPRRRFFFGTLLGALGTGLILSLNVIYVHRVRHESIFFAESLLVINAILGLAIAPMIGTVTDRVGPARVMVVGLFVEALGLVSFAVATTTVTLCASMVAIVLGSSGVWGPSSVMLTRLFDEEHRQRAYGLNFMLLNLGIGLGGLVSAAVVNLSRPSTFTHLYTGTAILTVLNAVVVISLRAHGRAVPRAAHDHETGGVGGWREVLADARLRHIVGATLLLMICGYGSIEAGFSLYVTQVAKLSVHFVGITFFFNTTTIVIAQLFTLRFIAGRRRTAILGTVGVLWGASWLLVSLTLQVNHAWALMILCVAMSIFALGETFWSPVAPALVNSIAPEHLRGRYNSAFGFTWGAAGTVAPLITGVFISLNIGWFWPIFVGVGALVGGFFARRIRRSLSDIEDGLEVDASSSES